LDAADNTWDLIAPAWCLTRTCARENPLDHHGQGLQSLSGDLPVCCSISAVDREQPGTEPIFLLERPDRAHLHPAGSANLVGRITALAETGVTTHSPYFVQNVPLRNLRLSSKLARCQRGWRDIL
jgi:putative ATP-dependent endonuclease of OLD family